MADSASSTKMPKADIREDLDQLANGRKGRTTHTSVDLGRKVERRTGTDHAFAVAAANETG
jgi:hypothetical protein